MVERGFTLVELCIVLVVMSILSMIAWSQYKNYLVRGRQTEVKITLLSLVQKLEQEQEEQITILLGAHQSPYFQFVASFGIDDSTGFRVWVVQAIPQGVMRGTGGFGIDSRGNSCFTASQDSLCVPQMRESWH